MTEDDPGQRSLTVIDKLAWITCENGRLLTARTEGREAFYLPGGKREPGESDVEALEREVREELGVQIGAGSAVFLGEFQAPADGHPEHTLVNARCYFSEYRGMIQPCSEIAEIAWLTSGDADRLTPLGIIILEALTERGLVL